jgi:hypothetical protein
MSFAEIIYPCSEATIQHANTATASNEKNAASPNARISETIDFLLCNSCFWCASYLNLGSFGVIDCPSCDENTIEKMPLHTNDVYSFDYNRGTGVVLEFSNYNKVIIVSHK